MVHSVWTLSSRIVPLVILAIVLTATAGCSQNSLTPVSGKVTVGDKPLTTGSVRFIPDKEKGNTATDEPTGTINESGTYELRTKNQPGAPAGWYKVVVVSQEQGDITKPTEIKSYVDKKFNKPETSGLSKEVKPGAAAGAYDLTVTP